MKFKQSIPIFKHILTAFMLSIMCLYAINPITAHASSNRVENIVDSVISSVVNSDHDNVQGGTDVINNGVSYTRTGYLCYLLTKDGSVIPGYSAVALQSPGYNGIDGSKWIAAARKGPVAYDWFGGGITAPWGCTLWAEGGSPSNEPTIKAWLKAKTIVPNVVNAKVFVSDVFGNEAATKFGQDEYVLVIESLLNLQFSKKNGATGGVTLTDAQIQEIFNQCAIAVTNEVISMPIEDVYFELEEGEMVLGYTGLPVQARAKLLEIYLRRADNMAYLKISNLQNNNGDVVGSRTYYGDPVIGTPSNLIQYDVWDTTVFDSYLNKVAPHAEKIAKSEAGFIAYTGSADKMTNDDVIKYGVAMMIVHCNDSSSQTTYDEPKGDTPAPPPQESEGTTTIIKSYREKNPTTNTYTDKGTYYLSNLSSNITIEDETTYKVVGWKTSTSPNLSISSLSWESSIPATIGQTGTTPTSITLPATQKYLYVLLEKTTTPPVITTNYVLPQSTISRHVTLNTPDAQLTLPKLSTHTFTWTIPKLDDTCSGHTCSNTGDDCGNGYTYECDSCNHGCTEDHNGNGHSASCPATCTTNHNGTGCDEECDSDCGDWKCNGHKCTEFGWTDYDPKLEISLKNENLSNYPYITSDKSGWNTVTLNSISSAKWILPYSRSSASETTVSKTNREYHTVIHRGKTDIIIADWKNTSLTKKDLGTDLSSTNYKVANQITDTRLSGRETADYTTNFTVKIVDGSPDTYTKIGAHKAAPKAGGKCSDGGNMTLNSDTAFTATPTVQVNVYPGDPTKAITNTDVNSTPQSSESSSGVVKSGVMLKSGTITNFTPYIQMKYQTINESGNTYETAYVLSENKRSLSLNSYAEIEWTKSPTPNLTLNSLQWSTHKEANANHAQGTVLPGGATLTLTIKKADRQKIKVVTYQPILTEDGLDQVNKTGGTTTLVTLSEVQTSHNDFVSDVVNNLENLNIQQFLATEDFGSPTANRSAAQDVFTSGGKVDNNLPYNNYGGSSETKYYFNTPASSETVTSRENNSSQGDLDIKILSQDTAYYTAYYTAP